MPKRLVELLERSSGVKIQANQFCIYLRVPSGFFGWQVVGTQPEPALVHPLEGCLTPPDGREGRGAAEPERDWAPSLNPTRSLVISSVFGIYWTLVS